MCHYISFEVITKIIMEHLTKILDVFVFIVRGVTFDVKRILLLSLSLFIYQFQTCIPISTPLSTFSTLTCYAAFRDANHVTSVLRRLSCEEINIYHYIAKSNLLEESGFFLAVLSTPEIHPCRK